MTIPSLSSVSPTSYTANNVGQTMDLFGSNFVSGDTLTFVDPQGQVFANEAASFLSSGELQASFNNGDDPGTWTVQVDGSSGDSNTVSFTVAAAAAAPSLSSVSPTSYPANNVGQTMELLGSNFVVGDTLTFVDPQGQVFANEPTTFVSSGEIETAFNDGDDPGTWTVQVHGSGGNSSTASFTVTAGAPTFTISGPGTVTEGNKAVFTVTMNGSISSPDTIWYSTFAGTASAADGDYPGTFVDQPLTFTPGGSTTQQISIPTSVTQNTHPDTFSVGLQNSEDGGAFTTAAATIVSNSGSPSFSISNAGDVTEGNDAVFTITMSGSISAPYTIWYSTFKGTASAADGDYPGTYVDQPLTFTPGGSNTQQIEIPTFVTQNAHPDTFSVGLQNTQTGGAFATGTATIVAATSAPPTPTTGPTGSQFPAALLSSQGSTFYNPLLQQTSSNLSSYLNTDTSITTPELSTDNNNYKNTLRAVNTDLEVGGQVIGDLGDAITIVDPTSSALDLAETEAGLLLQTPEAQNDLSASTSEDLQLANDGIDVLTSGAEVVFSGGTDPVADVGFALSGLSLGIDLLQDVTAAAIGNDPPDPDYQEVFVPAPIPVDPMAATGLPAGLVTAAQSAITDTDQATQWMYAIDVTENRYATALANGDTNAASMQYAAFLNDLSLYMSAAQAANTDIAAFANQLQANGLGMQAVTSQQITTAINELTTQGSSAATGLLESLGFTASEIQTMTQQAEAETAPSSPPSQTADQALMTLASEFSSVAPLTIQTNGPTSLIEGGANYFLCAATTSTGPELESAGAPVTAGEFGSWVPIGAVQTATGYDVAWALPGGNQYTVWSTDSSGNKTGNPVGVVAGNDPSLESVEPVFNQDLNGDGTIGVLIQKDGSTTLSQGANEYFVNSGNGLIALQYNGNPVTVGEFGSWVPFGAVQTATGYDVAWELPGGNQYTVWSTDSSGNKTSNVVGVVAGNDPTLEAIESVFNQDLNGDGTIGPVTTTVIQKDGSTTLSEGANEYFVNSGSGLITLKYNGSPVTVGEFGSWVPFGAVQAAGGGYDVAWKLPGGNQYTVWSTDSSGNKTGNIVGVVAGNDPSLESIEPVFDQDLNSDGTIGVLIQKDGSTTLSQGENGYYINSGSGLSTLQYNGSPVTFGEFGGWVPFGAVQTATGFDVAWKLPGGNQYTVWSTDSSGNKTGNTVGVVAGNDSSLESMEPVFDQDLNGDGTIGVLIQKDGSTTLSQGENGYYLNSGSGLITLQYNGSPVTFGEFASWVPFGAVQTATGYDVAWKLPGGNQYTVWSTDSSGDKTGNVVGVVAGNDPSLESIEPVFNQDLNGDGVIGIPSTSSSTQTLADATDNIDGASWDQTTGWLGSFGSANLWLDGTSQGGAAAMDPDTNFGSPPAGELGLVSIENPSSVVPPLSDFLQPGGEFGSTLAGSGNVGPTGASGGSSQQSLSTTSTFSDLVPPLSAFLSTPEPMMDFSPTPCPEAGASLIMGMNPLQHTA